MDSMVGWPKLLTLLNHFVQARYPMEIVAPMAIESYTLVDTAGRRNKNPIRRDVLDFTIKCATEEAVFLSAVYVKLPEGEPAKWWDEQFRQAKLSFVVDGEPVLKESKVIQHMVVDKGGPPEGCSFNLPTIMCNFHAITPYGDKGLYDERGLFLPNGAVLKAEIVGIPSGAGPVAIQVGCNAMTYRKAKTPQLTKE